VQTWEDYKFLRFSGQDGRPFEPLSEQKAARLMAQLHECPLLLRILRAYAWANHSAIGPMILRHLFNVSWGELRDATCRLRPIFPDGLPDLHKLLRFIHSSKIHLASWRANTSSDLAFACVRVRALIEAGNLPNRLWYVPTFNIFKFILIVEQVRDDAVGSLYQRIPVFCGIVEWRQEICAARSTKSLYRSAARTRVP
jgi:hypothetical protein